MLAYRFGTSPMRVRHRATCCSLRCYAISCAYASLCTRRSRSKRSASGSTRRTPRSARDARNSDIASWRRSCSSVSSIRRRRLESYRSTTPTSLDVRSLNDTACLECIAMQRLLLRSMNFGRYVVFFLKSLLFFYTEINK